MIKYPIDKMKKNKVIKLCGHHLLCLQGYQGYGYDSEFEKNMSNIHQELNKTKNKNLKIKISDSPDDLCICCPNLKDGICIGDNDSSIKTKENLQKIAKNNNHIVKLDSIVIKKINIDKNKEYYFNDVVRVINNTFKKLEDVKDICGDCEWTDKCLWYQSKK
ncbi:hypothetical protein ALNOE001_04560 [Candidatus Methanobinarius endosymbioticus]|uniref:DUF1284 domain-containing protein n=1 Tax=Candidatus Methanobinarius endosymbioticus TaxID=2006182 RepID=A0A366ME47_9EURY|nr:hypothetical protein ALNOE001_04560 [Candidatus Methanobinarius endosymbioticus]